MGKGVDAEKERGQRETEREEKEEKRLARNTWRESGEGNGERRDRKGKSKRWGRGGKETFYSESGLPGICLFYCY